MSIKRAVQLFASTVLLALALDARAQPSPGPLPTMKSLGVSCDDFSPIGGGVWKSTHPIELANGAANVTITLQTAIRPGATLAGLPLAAMLQAECLK